MNLARPQDTELIFKTQLSFQILVISNWKLKFLKMPYTIPSKNIKHLGTNITKYVQERYTKNYKTFLRDIKEDLNKLKDIPSS